MDKTEPTKCEDRVNHILFVDDDAYLLSITKTILERLGYIVTSAYNSSEAIELIKEYHNVFDVMITDYLMPGMNGIELAAEVNKLLENTPIILYTGTVELIDEKEIAETKIAEIVNKLCEIQDLDNIIKRVINGNLEPSPQQVIFKRTYSQNDLIN